jgi:hypothetical protein
MMLKIAVFARIEPSEEIAIARSLLLQTDIAEPPSCLVARGTGIHAGGDEIVRPLVDVKRHLAIDLTRDVIRAKVIDQARKPGERRRPHDETSGQA